MEEYKARCPEFDDVECTLGQYYPHCDMSCPMNLVAKNKYLYNNVPVDKERRSNYEEKHP